MRKLLASALILAAASFSAAAQNPYLPLWEYIPDGEPYVFEDPDCPGQYRVYVYGSHDIFLKYYCGNDQVVWSAPVDDLSNWRYDGVVFTLYNDANGELLFPGCTGETLYAPDVAVREVNGKKQYYFYPNVQGVRSGVIAVGDRPDGPFKVSNWKKDDPKMAEGVLGFDPAVFVDDDGKVYGYWGFEHSYGAELDPKTMCTVKPGTEIVDGMVGSCKDENDQFAFFEASSIRKIEDKYVFIYSRKTLEGEFGLPRCNYTLAYAYSDSPLGPWTYGGTIIDARARGVDDKGNPIATAVPYGNTHGSIAKVGDNWWVFYHRQTGTDEYSRQAMVAPISVNVEKGKGGKVTISEGEVTSEGFKTQGLNPLDKTPAGLACYLINPDGVEQSYPNFIFSGSYVKATRVNEQHEALFTQREPFCPVVNNTSGSVVGYKYFNFDVTEGNKGIDLSMDLVPQGVDGTITVLVGGPSLKRGGKAIATINVKASEKEELTKKTVACPGLFNVKGKQPLYFVFYSSKPGKSICEIYNFQFVAK